jgi:formylglycine-generating enzyme required for sulfatase activity
MSDARPPQGDFAAPYAPSVEDVQFLERLGNGLGAGRFHARLAGLPGTVSLLLEDPRHTDRRDFVAWARRLATVEHPTVPRLIRVEDVLSPAFVAFDYAPGETLQAALGVEPARPIPPLDALSMTLQVASGIRAAHRRGLTHGGLAPRTLVLSTREGAADQVRITGWLPCPESIDEAMRAADVRAVGSMLYRLLTGIVPPSEALEESRRDGPRLEGGGGRFDDVVLGWEEARRDLGGLSPLVVALLERADVHADIDRLIDLVVPYYRRLIDDEYRQVDTALAAARATRDEVERWQRQERELESKLRWVKQWLREHAEEAGTVAAGVAAMERRESRLRTLELEMGMLLDRALPPSTRPASVAPPALPPLAEHPTTPPDETAPAAPARARAPTEAPRPPPAPEPVIDAPPPAAEALGPPPAAAPRPTAETRRRERASDVVLRPRRSRVAPIAAALGLLAVAGGAWRMFAGPDAGYETAPRGPTTSVRPATALPGRTDAPPSVSPVASAPAPPTVPDTSPRPLAPTAPAPPTAVGGPAAPPGMVYVPPGRLVPGLDAAAVEAVLVQCRLDFGDRPQAKACTAELFKEEQPEPPRDVAGFFMDQYEVSQARYATCVDRGRCSPLRLHWDLPEQPATGVDLRLAEAFCRANDGRLPTVDEWLWAARGADGRAFPWGNAPIGENDEYRANAGAFQGGKRANGRADGHPYVGSIAIFALRGASPFGVINLSGNVREWTSTELSGSVVAVGGGWKSLGHELRLTRREYLRPSDFAPDLGFRCVRNLP